MAEVSERRRTLRNEPFRPLPETVTVAGRSVPVDTDFRVGVAVEMEILNEAQPDVAGLLFRFYLGRVPEDVPGALEALVDFWRGGDGGDGGEAERSAGRSERWYDFGLDADVLLSSFLSCYGIDLSTARLHWWTFRRLMLNLPRESPFMQRVHFRVADLSGMSKAERKHYRKMKELYRIPQGRTGENRDGGTMRDRALKRFEEARNYAEKQGP